MSGIGALTTEGWLFDLYPRGDHMVLWFILDDGRHVRACDRFQPIFHMNSLLELAEADRARLHQAIGRIEGLETAGRSSARDFWSGRMVEVESVCVTDLERLNAGLRKLARKTIPHDQ